MIVFHQISKLILILNCSKLPTANPSNRQISRVRVSQINWNAQIMIPHFESLRQNSFRSFNFSDSPKNNNDNNNKRENNNFWKDFGVCMNFSQTARLARPNSNRRKLINKNKLVKGSLPIFLRVCASIHARREFATVIGPNLCLAIYQQIICCPRETFWKFGLLILM